MAKPLRLKYDLSKKGVTHLIKKLDTWERKMPEVQMEFRRRSLKYMEMRAKFYIKQDIGKTWYQPTGNLLNSFEINEALGELVNTAYYSAFYEFGTGIKGSANPHEKAGEFGYQYNLNEYFDGWWYTYENESHFTRGLVAHRFMYRAIQDYINEEYKKIYNASFKAIMRGIFDHEY